MPPPPPLYLGAKLADYQTYSIAHSAQCKLNMAARDPDRNLRFMLGHAFLLDKALYRVAEIEDTSARDMPPEGVSAPAEEDAGGKSGSLARGHVKFAGEATPTSETGRGRDGDDDDAVDVDEYDDGGDEDDGLGLTRFASASEMPPRMVADVLDDDDEDEDSDEPVSPPTLPVDFDVASLVSGPESEDIGELYEAVRGCPCHGQKADKGKAFWEVKDSVGGKEGKRLAIMRFEAEA